MRKLLLALLFLCPHLAHTKQMWYFELKPGYYYFAKEAMRDIFHTGGFAMRAEVGYVYSSPFAAWIDGGYFQKTGRALGGNEKVKIKLGTMTAGLKLIYSPWKRCSLYAGAGPRAFFMRIANYSPYVQKHNNRNGIGGAFVGGIWFAPFGTKKVFFDAFLDYSIKKFHFKRNGVSSLVFDVRVDGLTAGLGVGYRF